MALKGLFQLKQFYDSISKLLLFPSFLPVFVPAQRNPAVPLNFKLNSPLTCISIVQKGSSKAVEQTQGSQQTKTTWRDGLWFERVGTNIQWLRSSLTGLCFQCISCVFLGCFSGLVRCAALQLGKYYSDLEAVLQSYFVPNVNKKGLPSVFKPRDTIHLISDFKVFFFSLAALFLSGSPLHVNNHFDGFRLIRKKYVSLCKIFINISLSSYSVWEESSSLGELKNLQLSLFIPIQLSTLAAIFHKRRLNSPNPAERHSAL